MITYIVKTLLCATVLFLIYILFLEREKMHRFNRYYLLFSIVFSFTVSFITIKSQSPIASVSEMKMPIDLAPLSSPNIVSPQAPVQTLTEASKLLPNFLLLVYIIITAFLLFRFVRNLSTLLLKVSRNKSIQYHGSTLVLTNDKAIPHSFLRYIFIDKDKFEQGAIEKEILQHELTHVNQKHSIDILMVELLMVFAWVIPLLYLYRKAILLNHEYLADEAVVNTFNEPEVYQLLLFEKVSLSNNLVLSSPFNYLTTKKRLIMMTRKTSQKVAILKQIALIPLIAAIGFLFSTKVIAQDSPKQSAKHQQVEASKTDAPQSVLDEYHVILSKYKLSTNKDVKSYCEQKKDRPKFDKSDEMELMSLYSKMSKKQQKQQNIRFEQTIEDLPKIIPTKKQLELWKNKKIYGLWINNKKVDNSVLNNYSNTDFDHVFESRLTKNPRKNVKYIVQINLMTNGYYKKWFAERMDEEKKYGHKILVMWCRNKE